MKWLFFPSFSPEIEPSSVWIWDNPRPGYVHPYPEFARTTPRAVGVLGPLWSEQVASDYTQNGVRYQQAFPYRFTIQGFLHGATPRAILLTWKERTRGRFNDVGSPILAETQREALAAIVMQIGDIAVWQNDPLPPSVLNGGNVYAEELRVRIAG